MIVPRKISLGDDTGPACTVIDFPSVTMAPSSNANDALPSGIEGVAMPIHQLTPVQLTISLVALAVVSRGVPRALPIFLAGAIAGARTDQNTYTLDGADVSDNVVGDNFLEALPAAVVPLPAESVEEFSAATTNANATFGRGSGGQFVIVTRSGRRLASTITCRVKLSAVANSVDSSTNSRARSKRAFLPPGLAFAAVYREGFETVLFYQALMFDAGPGPVLAGFARLRLRIGGIAPAWDDWSDSAWPACHRGNTIQPGCAVSARPTSVAIASSNRSHPSISFWRQYR